MKVRNGGQTAGSHWRPLSSPFLPHISLSCRPHPQTPLALLCVCCWLASSTTTGFRIQMWEADGVVEGLLRPACFRARTQHSSQGLPEDTLGETPGWEHQPCLP